MLLTFFVGLMLVPCFDAGVPRVIMARLLFGLGGCALITALFPFIVQSAR